MLSTLLRLYWWRLRTQPVQELLAIAGIAAGVALIFAVEIANTSVPASVSNLEHGIAGRASLEVAARAPEGFSEGLVSKVGEAPGVFGDSGVLQAHVTVIGPHGQLPVTLFGVDPGLTSIGGPIARRFNWHVLESAAPAAVQSTGLAERLRSAHVDTIALPEYAAHALGASAGQLLLVDVAGRAVVVLCGVVLSNGRYGALAESPVAIALLPAAQRITGLADRVNRILVLPNSGQQTVARAALERSVGGTLNVRPSDSEVSLLEGATRSSNQAATLFTALSVVVGLLFAYNAMLLTLPARRRYITRLRSMGAYRYELVSLLALEIIVLGLVASLVGLVLGDLLASVVFGGVPRYLTAGFPIGTQRVITTSALLVSVGGGMLATAVAAVGPAVGALSGGPLDTPGEPTQRSQSFGSRASGAAIGLSAVAIFAAVAIALLVPRSAVIGVLVLAVALGLLLMPAVPWMVERSRRTAARMGSAVGYVATTELRAAPTRATAVAATSAIAVFAIVAVGGALNDVRRGVTRLTGDFFGSAQVVVSPTSFAETAFPTQPFAPGPVVARLQRTQGVARVDPVRSSFLDVRDHRLLLLVKPQDEPFPVSSSQIIQGSASTLASRLRTGGWVALSASVAHEWHLRVGAPVVLPTPSGYASFRLAAELTNYGWPPGAVVMSPADYTRLWGTTGATILYVRLRSGVTETQGVGAVRQALNGTGLTASTRRTAALGIYSAANQGMAEISQISTLLLAAALLAVIAAMSGSIWQRRPRLATLKRLGMYRGELVGTIYLETGVVVLIGCLVGVVFGLFGQPLATQYVGLNAGFPEVFSPAAWLSVRTLVLATLLAMLATGLIGYYVTRRSVVWRSAA